MFEVTEATAWLVKFKVASLHLIVVILSLAATPCVPSTIKVAKTLAPLLYTLIFVILKYPKAIIPGFSCKFPCTSE